MRKIICHYHIFKNSGTTFDHHLERNFGDRHLAFDGPFPYFQISQDELSRIISANPDTVSFSSHQIRLPQPVSLDWEVLPIVFIRHPLLRVLSIYNYKRKVKDGTLLSNMAIKSGFQEWLEEMINNPTLLPQVSNTQTGMLGGVYGRKSLQKRLPDQMIYDLNQARLNISGVDLLARTEFFDDDVKKMSAVLARHGLQFNYDPISPLNVSSAEPMLPIADRVEKIRISLGEELFSKVCRANEQDMELFNFAIAHRSNSQN